jgi:hypothetical protein
LKAILFYIVIQLMQKLDLSKPFSSFASKKITQISYNTFSIGLLSFLARKVAENLSNRGFEVKNLNPFWVDGEAYILMAAVIFIIATIFSKGVEIQDENDLTV